MEELEVLNASAEKLDGGLDRFQLVETEQKDTFYSSAFFLGGNNMSLSGRYERDIFALGSEIKVTDSAEVLGDIYMVGNTVEISTDVTGNIYVFARNLILNDAEFGGDIYVAGTDNIEFRGDVKIDGLLKYEDTTELIGAKNATINAQETYTVDLGVSNEEMIGLKINNAVLSFCMNAVLAVAMLFVAKKAFEETKSKKVEKYNTKKALSDFGVGICVLVGMPLLALVALMTIVGAKVGLVLGLAYIVILLLANVAAGWLIGELFKKMIKKDFSVYLSTILGLAVLALLEALPLVGWIVSLLAFGVGCGIVTRMIFRRK